MSLERPLTEADIRRKMGRVMLIVMGMYIFWLTACLYVVIAHPEHAFPSF